MNSHDARAGYEEWHGKLAVDVETDTPWHGLLREHLDLQHDLAGRQVLEIGCGRGGLACWMARQVGPTGHVVASDFAGTAVTMAHKHALANRIGRVSFSVGDIQRMAHPDASFDSIVSCETVEHVPDPRQAIRELARVLRPGGRLFLTTPNYLGPMGIYRIYMRMRGRRYTEEGQPINNPLMLPLTRAWVAGTGLRVLRTAAVGHYLPVPGRPPIRLGRQLNAQGPLRWFALHSLIVAEKQ